MTDATDGWEAPARLPASPVLHLDGFDGPMDLLLDLAERQRIDLGRMSVLALAEQFVAELARLVAHVPIERRADWLVLATRLVLLRSRLLFPPTPEAAEQARQDAAAELERIEDLAQMRAAATWLQSCPQLGTDVFIRPVASPPRAASYVALMEACLAVLRGRGGRPEEAPLYRPVPPDLWRVADALARLRNSLEQTPGGGSLKRFLPPIGTDDPEREIKARAAVSSTLLAGLELARNGEVSIEQSVPFGEVLIAQA